MIVIVTDSFITFDVIGELSYGEPFGCLAQGSATEWAKSIIHVTVFATYDQAIRRVAGVDTWLRSLLVKAFMPAEVAKWRTLHVVKSKEKTLERMSFFSFPFETRVKLISPKKGLANKSTPNKDVIHHLLSNEDSAKSLSPTEIILNMILFASAGSETTSITLSAWTYLILTHPPVYRRLASEIRSVCSSPESITVDTVMSSLPYLGATLHEALRLFPPGAVAMQRVVPAGGAVIDGHYVPAGTTVAISPWVAGRSSKNFFAPDRFCPERWLKGENSVFENDRLGASKPFGHGPKKCIGEDLSFLEARLILSHLLWAFEMELCGIGGEKGMKEEEEEYRRDNEKWCLDSTPETIRLYQVLLKPNLWVRFREREAL